MNIHKLYLSGFPLVYVGIFTLKLCGLDRIAKFIIPVFVLTVFLYSLEGYRQRVAGDRLVSLALFFAFIGDLIINLTPMMSACIIPFALTHLSLIAYYVGKKGFDKKELLVLLPILLLSGLVYYSICGDIPGRTLKAVGLIYLGILDMMVWRGVCFFFSGSRRSDRWKAMWGALLFYVTDSIVCLHVIYQQRLFIIIIWSIYPAALGLLSMINKPILRFKNEG